MVLLRSPNYPEGNGQAGPSNGHWGNSYPAHLDSNQTLLGWSRVDRQALAVLDNGEGRRRGRKGRWRMREGGGGVGEMVEEGREEGGEE